MDKFSIELSNQILEEFRVFLDQREARLADALLLAMIQIPGQMGSIHLHGSGHFRLTQALQILTKQIQGISEDETTPSDWRTPVIVINQAFDEYVEVLEGSVAEFLSRIQNVDLTHWNSNFYQTALGFKELIAHRIEDLIWVYKRMEDLLLAYRSICRRHKNLWFIFGRIWSRFSSVLERGILKRLFGAEERLTTHFKRFSVSFEAFLAYGAISHEKEGKFGKFLVFSSLPPESQSKLLSLFRLMQIWEENTKHEVIQSAEIINSIKHLAKPGVFKTLFREYLQAIRLAFFELCLKWQEFYNPALSERVLDLKKELESLQSLMGNYREIYIRLDPNPYVRTRWSFTEWVVGPEPRKTKDLLHLLYDIDTLGKFIQHLLRAIEMGRPQDREYKKIALEKQLREVIHEMGQPLSSRSLIEVKGERFIELLDLADELGGSLGDVRDLVSDALLKAMRHDAKYQVLYDSSRFEELYLVHEGVMIPIKDPAHEQRLKLFQEKVRHVEVWIKEHSVQAHAPDLEIDEAALQEAFQKLLAATQRGEAPLGGTFQDYLPMLVIYWHRFGRLFHSLRVLGAEGKAIRSHFLFVDWYLEAIEKQVRSGLN